MSNSGPCVICGATNYSMSAGGPTICPACDCGNFGVVRIQRQSAELAAARAEVERLKQANAYLSNWRQEGADEIVKLASALTLVRDENTRLRAALSRSVDALDAIEQETKYYEQPHLRRIWKTAGAALESVRKELE